ncbi:MAG: hypothetical protein ACM3UU_08845 [Ignavibacteriales bacterium]
MADKQAIKQCADTCTQAANNLRSAANSIGDPAVRDMLTQGAHHIELCVRQCDRATKM